MRLIDHEHANQLCMQHFSWELTTSVRKLQEIVKLQRNLSRTVQQTES